MVEGVQMIKRHTRANPQRNIKGGIVEKEAPIQHFERGAGLQELQEAHAPASTRFLRTADMSRTCKKCGSAIE